MIQYLYTSCAQKNTVVAGIVVTWDTGERAGRTTV